jgi:hypothetical protein
MKKSRCCCELSKRSVLQSKLIGEAILAAELRGPRRKLTVQRMPYLLSRHVRTPRRWNSKAPLRLVVYSLLPVQSQTQPNGHNSQCSARSFQCHKSIPSARINHVLGPSLGFPVLWRIGRAGGQAWNASMAPIRSSTRQKAPTRQQWPAKTQNQKH